MSDAQGFFGDYPMIDKETKGELYFQMEYIGSQIRKKDDFWFICTDYLVDSKGRHWWRDRYFRVMLRTGELQFCASSEYIFGRKIPAWDRSR
jgi:hypothetical protein